MARARYDDRGPASIRCASWRKVVVKPKISAGRNAWTSLEQPLRRGVDREIAPARPCRGRRLRHADEGQDPVAWAIAHGPQHPQGVSLAHGHEMPVAHHGERGPGRAAGAIRAERCRVECAADDGLRARVAERVLGDRRQRLQVRWGADILGPDAGLIEVRAIEWHRAVGMIDQATQLGGLQLGEPAAVQPLRAIEAERTPRRSRKQPSGNAPAQISMVRPQRDPRGRAEPPPTGN